MYTQLAPTATLSRGIMTRHSFYKEDTPTRLSMTMLSFLDFGFGIPCVTCGMTVI